MFSHLVKLWIYTYLMTKRKMSTDKINANVRKKTDFIVWKWELKTETVWNYFQSDIHTRTHFMLNMENYKNRKAEKKHRNDLLQSFSLARFTTEICPKCDLIYANRAKFYFLIIYRKHRVEIFYFLVPSDFLFQLLFSFAMCILYLWRQYFFPYPTNKKQTEIHSNFFAEMYSKTLWWIVKLVENCIKILVLCIFTHYSHVFEITHSYFITIYFCTLTNDSSQNIIEIRM